MQQIDTILTNKLRKKIGTWTLMAVVQTVAACTTVCRTTVGLVPGL